jgi:DNA-binding beta-propeller fold protein YncE
MGRAVCAALLGAAVLAAGARADQTALAHGALLAFRAYADGSWRVIDLATGQTRWRLPPGPLGGHLVVHRDGNLVTWFDADTGVRVGDRVLQAKGAFALVGTSQDGRTAVLARTQTRSTTFSLVTMHGEREVVRPGHWRFDALDGQRLTLSRTSHGRALAVVRLPRYVIALYGSGVVRVVDGVRGSIRLLRLRGVPQSYALAPDPDGRHVWALSPSAGKVVSIDAATARVASSFSFTAGRANAYAAAAAVSPDGEHVAVSDGTRVWIVVPATRSVQRLPPHVAIALGWAPDQSRLWVVGERSRVSPLRLRLR